MRVVVLLRAVLLNHGPHPSMTLSVVVVWLRARLGAA
jgi:hypothetical protein